MKKLTTTALCLAFLSGGIATAASPNIVDQAEKATKGMTPKTSDLIEARNLIKEALANPEYNKDAKTYYVAGNIEMKLYDNGFNAKATGQNNSETDPIVMGAELMDGYNYLMMALPLDSVTDAKGKIKTKYSKDINKLIKDHNLDFFRVGADYYQAGKAYPEAYDAFMVYVNLPEDMMKDLNKLQPENVSKAYFFGGLGAYNAGEYDKSAQAFKNARLTGFEGPDPYVNEMASWSAIVRGDESRANEARANMQDVAKAGYETFGLEQPLFINNLISAMVTDNKEAEAMSQVNGLIASNPDNSNLYGLRAYIYSVLNNDDEALADYTKAVSFENAPFEVLKNASEKFYRVGVAKFNELDFTAPDIAVAKQDVKSKYFDRARQYAQRANQVQSGDPEVANLIDSIDYIIETNY